MLNGQPVNTVTTKGLEDIIQNSSGNKSYKLPLRQVASARIDNLYEFKKEEISQVMHESVFVALTADY